MSPNTSTRAGADQAARFNMSRTSWPSGAGPSTRAVITSPIGVPGLVGLEGSPPRRVGLVFVHLVLVAVVEVQAGPDEAHDGQHQDQQWRRAQPAVEEEPQERQQERG